MNYKGKLLEVLKELGMTDSRIHFNDDRVGQQFRSSVTIHFHDGRRISNVGEAPSKKEAHQRACAKVLEQLRCDHPDLLLNWTTIMVEAQVGDALLKLCAYRSSRLPTAEDGSKWLQSIESDAYMVELFDELRRRGHTDVAIFGDNIGSKRKASWIEALIARRFTDRVLRPDTRAAFDDMMRFMNAAPA